VICNRREWGAWWRCSAITPFIAKATPMYVILQRKGYSFASEGTDYVIVFNGIVIFRDMNKLVVEREFRRIAA